MQTYALDITDSESVSNTFKALSEINLWGLVNNAGIYLGKALADYSPQEINLVMNVNVVGAMILTQQFAKYKQKEPGVIINLSSVSGQEGSSDAVYGASKAALLGLTKSSAYDLAPNIWVNAITPGIVLMDMMQNIPDNRLKEYRSGELLEKPIMAENVANTVCFLLSEAASNYTGATFDLNNGVYRR